MGWVFLMVAIVSEVLGTLSLKASDGLSKLGPALVMIVAYGLSFTMLALALKTLPVGTAYAVWSGVGTAGAVMGAWFFFGERLPPISLVGIGIVIVGVVVMNVPATH
ncbi:MAG: multidrug efflux SMR transporter [Actinomycetes bacterium]